MLTINMFSTKESYKNYLSENISGVNRAIATYKKNLVDAQNGVGREQFLKINLIPDDCADEYWNHHIEWIADYLKSLERKLKRFQRELQKI